jgi:hypothetical protein
MLTTHQPKSSFVSKLSLAGSQLKVLRPEHLAFILSLVALIARAYFRIVRQGLWAEDANLFLNDSFSQGISALWQQYAGYYHTLPRIISYLSLTLGPLQYYPAITETCCLLLTAYTFSRFAKVDYRCYVPHDPLRIFASVAFCFAPGLSEVAANLANLHWICFTFLWLLAIRPYQHKITNGEVLFAILSIFSAGETIVCLPLLAWRAFRHKFSRSGLQDMLLVGASIVSITINLLQRNAQPGGTQIAVVELLKRAPVYVMRSVSIDPIYGLAAELKIAPLVGDTVYLILSAVIAIAFAYYVGRKVQNGWVLLVGYGCAASVAILTWLVRPESERLFGAERPFGDYNFRYSFIGSINALVVWLTFLSIVVSIKRGPWTRYLALSVFLLLYMRSNTRVFPLQDFYTSDWRQFASEVRQLAASCEDRVIEHPVQPPNWKVSFTASKSLYCPTANTARR